MRLTLIPLANSRSIKILVTNGRKQWEKIAENGEAVVGALDKVFEIAKIDLRSVRSIRVMAQEHSSLLSLYLAHTTKQALRIAKEFQDLHR